MKYPHSGNDGVVGFQNSCQLTDTSGKPIAYAKTPTNRYYAFRGNHLEGTCSFGNVPNDPTRQSCDWIVNMAKRELTQPQPAAGLGF